MKFNNLILLIFVAVLSACEFESADIQYNMGTTFIDDPTQVVMVDTLKVNSYTTVTDSFKTSGTTRFLAGSYTNMYGIETYCESYFRVEPTSTPTFHETSVFDSIHMILYLDDYHFGDTTKIGAFEIYRLTEAIDVDEDYDVIYNVTKFETEFAPLGSFSIDLEDDDQRDSVIVNLPYDLGQEIFGMIDRESDTLDVDVVDGEVTYTFQDIYLKGFAIKPVENTSAFIVGFNAAPDSAQSPRLRFYYHDNSIADEMYFDFSLEQNSKGTNYLASCFIENRYENSVLAGSEIFGEDGDEKSESSLNTNNVTFLQPGFLQTRIEIPNIDEFHYIYGIGAMLKCELYMEPVKGTYSEVTDLPYSLAMDLVNPKNEFYNSLYKIGTTENQYGYLYYNDEFKAKTYYAYEITNYVQTEYQDVFDPNYSLRLRIPFNSDKLRVDQLIIGDSFNEEDQLKLKMYISSFNSDILIND